MRLLRIITKHRASYLDLFLLGFGVGLYVSHGLLAAALFIVPGMILSAALETVAEA